MQQKAPHGREAGGALGPGEGASGSDDFVRLRPVLRFLDLECDILAFGERSKTFTLDGREVDENIVAFLRMNEAVSLSSR
jgi:hypothetical protein